MGSLNCRKWNTIPIINSSLKGFFHPPASGKRNTSLLKAEADSPKWVVAQGPTPKPFSSLSTDSSSNPTALHREIVVFVWITVPVTTNTKPISSLRTWAKGWALLLHCRAGRHVKLWSKQYWGPTKETLLCTLDQKMVFGADFVEHLSVWHHQSNRTASQSHGNFCLQSLWFLLALLSVPVMKILTQSHSIWCNGYYLSPFPSHYPLSLYTLSPLIVSVFLI